MTAIPQHMTALASANARRLARAELRHQVHDVRNYQKSCGEFAEILAAGVPDCMLTMPVADALSWVFLHGRHRRKFVNDLLDIVGCTEWRLLKDLTLRQRTVLVRELRWIAYADDLEAAA